MRPNLPEILSDGDSVTALGRNAETVFKAMRQWGIIRVDDQKTVEYCGLIYHPKNGTVIFLPKEARTDNIADDMKTASLTMRALARFGAETSKLDFENDGDSGNPGTLPVIKRLADDFRNNGLFSERIRWQTRNAGKPEWARTAKRELGMPNKKGQPVYLNIWTSHAAKSTDALLAQIQAAVVREIHLAHAWWLTGTSSRRQEILSCPRPSFPRATWARKLDALLPSLYSARSISLANDLRFYLDGTRKSSDGTLVFGVRKFHTVWETMLRETIIRSEDDKRRNWNSDLPKPSYFSTKSLVSDARRRGMQTDMVLETKTELKIVDAKYYTAKTADTAPGWGDISKQFFYEKAIETLLKSESKVIPAISSIFAFPSTAGQGNLSYIEMVNVDGTVATTDLFSKVVCCYVSVSDALDCYVNNRQGITI